MVAPFCFIIIFNQGADSLTNYELLLREANNENVNIFEIFDLSETRFKGLYCDGFIALDKDITSECNRRVSY